jgi:hypothetical protein
MQKKSALFPFIIAIALSCVVFLASSYGEQKSPVSAQTVNVEKTQTPAVIQANNSTQPPAKIESSTPAVARPALVSRQEWKAKAGVGEAKQHTLRYITIHHTATLQKEAVEIDKKMQSLQNFSQKEGRLDSGKTKPAWFDVPYHYYIAVDGKIAEGREIKFAGDTNTDYDPTGHALIVLEGNFETEQPSAKQLKALQALTAWLSVQYKIPTTEVRVHNDYASTACPGKNLKRLLPAILEKITEIINIAEKP